MNKTLLQLLLEPKYQNADIKIGTKQGKFIYGGKGSDAIATLDSVWNKCKLETSRKLKWVQERMENLDEIYDRSIENINNDPRITKKNKYNRVSLLGRKKEAEKISLSLRHKAYTRDLQTKFINRKVLEITNSAKPSESGCKVIYIEGNEIGFHWTLEQFNKGRQSWRN